MKCTVSWTFWLVYTLPTRQKGNHENHSKWGENYEGGLGGFFVLKKQNWQLIMWILIKNWE